MERKKLTREEMWEAITNKFKSLRVFSINCRWKEYHNYKKRGDLFDILIEMKIHKSRHLTKKQKIKAQYELNLLVIEKL